MALNITAWISEFMLNSYKLCHIAKSTLDFFVCTVDLHFNTWTSEVSVKGCMRSSAFLTSGIH